ncbi:hypothetical protein ABZ468_53240 [Streptomyces sp. NPDC005708]|uniref:hypothetical protein n=1 Tax=unclassified Streptomyces TaxID=2593676 RepID=UPI0033EBAF4F
MVRSVAEAAGWAEPLQRAVRRALRTVRPGRQRRGPSVYHPWMPAALVLGGWLMARAGALVPAGWAARSHTAAALRTE